jgi:superfamily II DNA/RNA helicase
MCPTRDIAARFHRDVKIIGAFMEFTSLAVWSGQVRKIAEELEMYKPQIVVGTPGGISNLYNRRILKLDSLKLLVVDEAQDVVDVLLPNPYGTALLDLTIFSIHFKTLSWR